MGNLFLRVLAVCEVITIALVPFLARWLDVSGREGAIMGALVASMAVCVAVGITELIIRKQGL